MSPIQGDEFSGRTVEEAVERGLRELGKRRDQVDIEVLEKGKPANMLGLGGEDARVLLSYESAEEEIQQPVDEAEVPRRPAAPHEERAEEEEEAPPAYAEELPIGAAVVRELLDAMEIEAEVMIEEIPGREGVEIGGPDLGVLIGRGGENLVALQQVVSAIASRRVGRSVHVPIDVEGYRRRREDHLREVAKRVAERVKATGQAVTLEPMLAYERRIVHLAVQGTPGVRTESVGIEPSRRVVIASTAPGARGPVGAVRPRPPMRGGFGQRRPMPPRPGGMGPRYGTGGGFRPRGS